MSPLLKKPVLLTGASGNMGRFVAGKLAAAGWTLKLTDLAPFPGLLPDRATFTRVDLANGLDVLRVAEGCGLIIHLGGASHDLWPFEDVLNGNLRGTYHIYEAARRERARVVFASSNHVTGFHERTTLIEPDTEMRPDSLYAVSKGYGELMGRLYWMKHGVETIVVRVGACFPEPKTRRMLSLWFSYEDLARLMIKCGEAEKVGYKVILGVSNNPRSWWRRDTGADIGWMPQDNGDLFAEKLLGVVSGNPISEKYQGGDDTTRG
jgi:uronate dehydrogenase